MGTLSTRSLEELRSGLNDKLGELHRRANHAKDAFSPSTYLANPWVRLGLAFGAGFLVGSRLRGTASGGILHTIVRAGLGAAVSALVGSALAPRDDRAPPAVERTPTSR